MGLETGLQWLSFSLLPYLSSFKYLQAIVMFSSLKQSYYCGNTVVMSTGNTGWVRMLLLRDVGLARKWKPPMCVIRLPPEIQTFLPLLFWKSKSHQTPHLGNWGTGTLSETSTSIPSGNSLILEKWLQWRLKVLMYHGDENTQEGENQRTISAALLQTLRNSTSSNREHELLLPPCVVPMSKLFACKLESWGAVSVCTIYCLLIESLERSCSALLQWTV